MEAFFTVPSLIILQRAMSTVALIIGVTLHSEDFRIVRGNYLDVDFREVRAVRRCQEGDPGW